MMKRLKILLCIFCLALSIPLAYLILLTYRSLEQEEMAELQYFANTMFDKMEKALATLVLREEQRAVDAYDVDYQPAQTINQTLAPTPLSQPPEERYILGYFQNNPDGAFQTPLAHDTDSVSPQKKEIIAELKAINQVFNRKRTDSTYAFQRTDAPRASQTAQKGASLASNYLKQEQTSKSKTRLGLEKNQVQKITPRQALAFKSRKKSDSEVEEKRIDSDSIRMEKSYHQRQYESDAKTNDGLWDRKSVFNDDAMVASEGALNERSSDNDWDMEENNLTVEVAPMQAVFINDKRIFLFRRIVIDKLIYRQGLVLRADEFLNHLAQQFFTSQPMARFTHLELRINEKNRRAAWVEAGVAVNHPQFSLARHFPRPFSFLHARLTCERIPQTAGRRTLSIMLAVLAGVILIGFLAIYQSARAIVKWSERRSDFVSSVTHELKTPLTNIRMYIEMLEQGIASSREREQAYFRILDSESARLSRLINNVLEFSKLERKELRLDPRPGTFEEVLDKIQEVFSAKLHREGFTLLVEHAETKMFRYDREIMIQILINLIENCIKFGRSASLKEITLKVAFKGDWAHISVSDAGPGVPRHALKKIFDDFFRVDNSATRTTRGTGIGLAFVKKCIQACGGRVAASNNDGPGCTITLMLPV